MSLYGYAEHRAGWMEAAVFKVVCPRELRHHSEQHWDKSAPSHHEQTVLSHYWPHSSFASETRKVLTLLKYISQAYYLEMWAWDTHRHRQTDRQLPSLLGWGTEEECLYFFTGGNRLTFTSSCLKLLLNICKTVSKETVRGSIKFSNSSSSSPIEQKEHYGLKCMLMSISFNTEYLEMALWRGQPAFPPIGALVHWIEYFGFSLSFISNETATILWLWLTHALGMSTHLYTSKPRASLLSRLYR